MRHEGVGYSLLGSDTAICGISVEGKAESQRSHIGDTEGFIGTQRHGDTESILLSFLKVQRALLEHRSAETQRISLSFLKIQRAFRTPWICPPFPVLCLSPCPIWLTSGRGAG